MRNNILIILFSIIIVFTASSYQIIKKNTVEKISIDKNSTEKKLKDSIPFKDYIVAYENNIPILSSPSENADTNGFLKNLEIVERFTSFYNSKGNLTECNFNNSEYYPIKYQNDTAWVKRKEAVSIKYEIDTVNNLVFRNVYTLGGFFCSVCYQHSIIFNLKTNKLVWTHSLNLENSFSLNDSLFLFNFSDSITIYNLYNDSYIYKAMGGAIKQVPELNEIYFLSWSKGKYNVDSPCKLLKYNYVNNIEKTLFVENEITKRPYWWDPNFRHLTDLQIKDSISNMYLIFTLFQMKEDAEDEGDFNEFKIIVDTSGKVTNE